MIGTAILWLLVLAAFYVWTWMVFKLGYQEGQSDEVFRSSVQIVDELIDELEAKTEGDDGVQPN